MSNSVNLSLDVTKTGIQNPLIKVRQGDGGFETLRTTVTANGEPMDLQGWTITFMGTTAGNHKIVDGNVTLVEAPNGIFDYTPSKAWGMDIGDFKIAYFKFVKGDGSASSANFRVSVIEAVDLTQEEAQHYISVVDTTIAEINQHLTDSLANVTQSIADANANANSVASNVTTLGNRVDDYNNNLADIQIGGRNLLLNSKSLFPVATNAGASYTIEDYDANTKMWHITAPAGNTSGSTGVYFSTTIRSSAMLVNGEKWVMSLDIKGSGYMSRFGLQKSSITSPSGNVPTEWTRLSSSGVMQGTSTDVVIYFNTSTVPLDVYVKLPKLENGNVATDWTPAPEDAPSNDAQLVHKTGTETIAGDKTFTGNVNFSGNVNLKAYINKSKELPAISRDFGYLAQHMQEYQGFWWNGAESVANAPADNWTWSVIEVIPGNAGSNGVIKTMRTGDGIVYSANVNFGYIQHWTKFADDANVLHNTGNETAAGDKTFTGNTKLAQTTILAGNYGLRVTPSGFQKTTDGRTWVSANI